MKIPVNSMKLLTENLVKLILGDQESFWASLVDIKPIHIMNQESWDQEICRKQKSNQSTEKYIT